MNWERSAFFDDRLCVSPQLRLGGVVRLINHRCNLREYLADADGHVGHGCARGNGNKGCHESVLNQVLTALILPDPQSHNQIVHLISSPFRFGARRGAAAIHSVHRQVLWMRALSKVT